MSAAGGTRINRSRSRRANEHGYFTLWVLGLCVCLFFIGGISLDLWRVFSDRREVANLTDGASTAAASQLDLNAYRATPSTVKLDPGLARQRATTYLTDEAARNHIKIEGVVINVTDTRVTVSVTTEVDTTLTKILAPTKTYKVTTTSAAEPRTGH